MKSTPSIAVRSNEMKIKKVMNETKLQQRKIG